MQESAEVGFSFGFTSAILTTLGLFMGLATGLGSQKAVISGILIIALADALSDSMAIHLARESERKIKSKEIWKTTVDTFLAKFIIAITFLFPLFLFKLKIAMIISFIWGIIILSMVSYHIAKRRKEKILKVVLEHIIAAIIIVFITYFIGIGIQTLFN